MLMQFRMELKFLSMCLFRIHLSWIQNPKLIYLQLLP